MSANRTIIKTLDDYMKKQGKDSLTPPEANQWLERKGLLADSKSRPGLPLRKLLRAGMLPHVEVQMLLLNHLMPKIKAFRATSRGVTDITFFLFRLKNIYA